MGLRDRFVGVLKKALNTIYSSTKGANLQLDSAKKRGELSGFRGALVFDDRVDLPEPISRDFSQRDIPDNIAPFTSQLRYDKRFRQYIDQETNRIVGRKERELRLSDHRRDVLLASASKRNPTMPKDDIVKLVSRLQELRKEINYFADRQDRDDLKEFLQGELDDIKEALLLNSP